MTSRKDILNEFESVTDPTRSYSAVAPASNSNNIEDRDSKNTNDIRIITKAMEKLVMDIKQLKEDNAYLKRELIALKAQHQATADRLADVSHSVAADQQLHDWQKEDANDEDVFETPISNSELMRKMNDYDERRRRAGMN